MRLGRGPSCKPEAATGEESAEVEQSGACLVRVGLQRRRCPDHRGLDLVRGQRGAGLEQCGGDTGGERSGLRAPGSEQGAVDDGLGVVRGDRRAGGEATQQRASRGHQVGVATTVTGCRPGRDRGGGDGGRGRRQGVGGADGDHPGADGWGHEATEVAAVVAGRGQDHDVVTPRSLDRVGERGGAGGVGPVGAEGQRQHADVASVGVAVAHDPVDAGEHLRDVRDAALVGHLHVHQADTGCDAGDDPGHRRSVAVAVAQT